MSMTFNEALDVISDALQGYRETQLPPDTDESYDAQWDEICSAMEKINDGLQNAISWEFKEDEPNDSLCSAEYVQSEATGLTHE